MEEMKFNDQRRCADLLNAIGTALYCLEVRNDPAGARQILNEARERSVKDYLAVHGPIYDGVRELPDLKDHP